ncbi:hypothetical protein [Archangium sp.]|uniref:hypothetical protein n=1 Tax=Archangium sp. TaxID=1872627 RepID=UPI00389A03C9
MSKASGRQSLQVARAFDQLIAATSDNSFEVLEGKYKALERHLLRSVIETDFERKELRRRIAERLFTEAFAHDCPWPILGRTLRRIQRLGYSNVERRYHVACLYAMWCARHREHDPRQARRLLDETEQHLLRLPRSSRLRQGLLEALTEKRRETGLQPLDG